MHVLLASIGTDGDLLPYVGLGEVLRARGHDVTLSASAHYEGLAQKHDLAFQALVSTEENKELFDHPDFWNPWKTAPLAARWGVRFLRRQYDLFSKLIRTDTVLVANPGIFAVGMIHEKFGVPWTNLVLQPGTVPSSDAPPIMPGFSFLEGAPRPVWKLFWRGLDWVGDALVGRELNSLRVSLGLRPVRRLFQNWLSPQLAIGMFPDWYGPPQRDWPPQLHLTGFPMFDGGSDEGLSPHVLEFCRNGKPPVVFTFGTGMVHCARLFQEALAACDGLGLRAIFLTKYRQQLPESLPASVLHCAFAPFQKLFPHCAAAVHHGGVGTVAKAMSTGVPQLIHPICFDQRDNGMRVRKLGAGDCLAGHRPKGREIALALEPLLTEKAQATARQLMMRFEGVDALSAAANLVEQLAADRMLPLR